MAVKTKVLTGGDVLIHRESVQYNMESMKVKGAASGGAHNVTQIAGYPIKVVSGQAVLIIAADDANVTGVLLHGPEIESLADDGVTADSYSVITNGENVVLNRDALPAADCSQAATALSWVDGGDLVTALVALGFKFVDEPTKQTTQTN